jgi:hypothetical protein
LDENRQERAVIIILNSMSEKRHYKKKGFKPYSPKTDELLGDSDNHFSFIAGYTSSGVPFGLIWDEYEPNPKEKCYKPPKK